MHKIREILNSTYQGASQFLPYWGDKIHLLKRLKNAVSDIK